MLAAGGGSAADTDVMVLLLPGGSVPAQGVITLQDNEHGVVGEPLKQRSSVTETGRSGP